MIAISKTVFENLPSLSSPAVHTLSPMETGIMAATEQAQTKSNMKQSILTWIVTKPILAASTIALAFAALGFFLAKKIGTKTRRF